MVRSECEDLMECAKSEEIYEIVEKDMSLPTL